jgi:hypothetical protein
MQGIKGIFGSKRGTFCFFLVAACTVFVILGKMTIDQWTEYTKWIAGFLVIGHTVTDGIKTLKGPSSPAVPVATASTSLGG